MVDFRMNDVVASMPLYDDQWQNMTEKQREEWEADAKKREAIHQSVVFGHDHKVHKGQPVEQGIGARGRETMNHFNSVRRYEGEEFYWSEVARIWKDHPKHAEKLAKQGLPKPRVEKKA
jgi:hypothetical protein